MWFKFLLFIIYAIFYGAMLHNISFVIPKDIVDQFLIGILISFILYIIFFYIILYYEIDINFAGFIFLGFIIGALSSLIIKLNYDIFFKNKNIEDINRIYFLYSIIILFTIYFCYSTNVIMRINYNDDYITAAVDLYLGFLNTIIYIAELDNIKFPKLFNITKS
jgi:heme/copper-type cytochrome/quinol oxidase subunit 4